MGVDGGGGVEKTGQKKERVDWHGFEFELLPIVPQSEPQ